MLRNAFKYTALKSKRWFNILFLVVLMQSAIMQVASKFLIIGLADKYIFLYQLILGIITAPLQMGLIKILFTLHEQHRFRPNQLWYFYGGVNRFFKAIMLGVLNAGLQTAFNMLGKYSGGISAGGTADGLTQMPFVTGMLSAALMLFLFMVNYIYVADETKKVSEIWLQSVKMGMGNVVSVAVTVFVGSFLSYMATRLLTLVGAQILIMLGVAGSTAGGIGLTIIAYVVQSIATVFLVIFSYGVARQILGDTKEELLGIEEKHHEE